MTETAGRNQVGLRLDRPIPGSADNGEPGVPVSGNLQSPTSGRLTNAQRRAMEWLPADGSWRSKPGRMTAALSSLSVAWSGCVECEWGRFGARGGMEHRWRLNAKGVEIKRIVANAY